MLHINLFLEIESYCEILKLKYLATNMFYQIQRKLVMSQLILIFQKVVLKNLKIGNFSSLCNLKFLGDLLANKIHFDLFYWFEIKRFLMKD